MDILTVIELFNKIDIDQAIDESLKDTKDDLLEYNLDQMSKGVKADAGKIKHNNTTQYPYSTPYSKKRKKAGLQTSHVDLRFTGGFYEDEDVNISGGNIIFDNKNEVNKYLEGNYGKEIHGITDENTAKYTFEKFLPSFIKELALQIGINI